jgi:beta-glucosidase
MEFGNALADVLLGAVEPGGRLPTTWPRGQADAPVLDTTPVDGRPTYDEGLHIGHRGYLKAGIEPAYWFGHGLGYTSWAYESITASPTVVTVRVRNTGPRPGKEVVQVYAARPDSTMDRPVLVLAGFAVVTAGPGEALDVPVAIDPRVLRHWDLGAHRWAVEPGTLLLRAGRSVGDLPLHATLEL